MSIPMGGKSEDDSASFRLGRLKKSGSTNLLLGIRFPKGPKTFLNKEYVLALFNCLDESILIFILTVIYRMSLRIDGANI